MIHTFEELIKNQSGLDGDFLIDPDTDERVPFSDIDVRTAEIADSLISAGMKHGDRVALALTNGIGACLTVLGVIRAGGVLVPVNPGLRETEFEYIISNSQASFLVSNDDILAECGINVRKLDTETIGDIVGAKLYALH
ncbi:MAG: acyl--CoA ligase, partial [Ruminiclostridium sp.]|nr:acyl--CoA ligase [Ruminiclostridium sp.]